MIHMPSDIMAEYLMRLGVLSRPVQQAPWPCSISSMPQEPNEAACLYDTVPLLDGRLMKTGEVVEHPGIQLKVRDSTAKTGYAKAAELRDVFDSTINYAFTFEGNDYTIQNISRSSGVLSLGQEQGQKKRFLFTVNAFVTILPYLISTPDLDENFLVLDDGDFLELVP